MDQRITKELESLSISQDVIAKIQDAERVVVNLDTGESAAFPEREPCQYKPVSDATTFLYDPKDQDHLCQNSDLAEFYVRRWESKVEETNLNAEDYNNIGCAYLWLEKPDWQESSKLFQKASERMVGRSDEDKKTIISQNQERAAKALDDQPELPIRINLRTYQVLKQLRGQVNKHVETATASEIRRLLEQWE